MTGNPYPEDADLVAAAQGGCRDAQTRLLAMHEGLWRSVAVRESRANRAADLDDLLQAARIGFLYALKRYDASLGNKYTTYAGWWVMSFVRGESHKTRKIHVPENLLYTETDRAVRRMHSLDWRDDRTEKAMLEVVSPSADVLYEFDEKELLHLAVSKLHLCYQQVLQARFFDGLTLEETGLLLGVTKERVRQLENKAILRLRRLYSSASVGGQKTERVSVGRERLRCLLPREGRERTRRRRVGSCLRCGSLGGRHLKGCPRSGEGSDGRA